MLPAVRRAIATLLAGLCWASGASAQVNAVELARALKQAPGRLRTIVRGTAPGLVQVAPGMAAFEGTPAELLAFSSAHPKLSFEWAPPRRPLIDAARVWVGAPSFQNMTGLRGKGVVVGIVDTGFDPKHPDLQNPDGSTRVAWALDLSRGATGRHPSLETEFGCVDSGQCAILDASDIDELIANGGTTAPRDAFGHGTHVASLAAGNGRSTDPPRYAGIAPEATYVMVRVTRGDDGAIYDPDVLLATKFVFDRAEALGMPAVVNLSLGSDFGGHDGSAALEQGLASFVGADHPGRAIVVAAGNSAGVYGNITTAYPEPFGIHTEVHVPRASVARVPILSPTFGPATTHATIYIWIASRPGDALEVGLDDADGKWIDPLSPGQGGSYEQGNLTATIINQQHRDGSPIPTGNTGAVVVLDGSWKSGSTFALRLQGHGTASVWLQSEGDLSPGAGSTGALFPKATKEGTIGIPASSSELISVGATINRVGWPTRDGKNVKIESFGAMSPPVAESTAYFSGAGPNALGQIKPDISAPGAFVVGAMSSLVDPAKNGGKGLFTGASTCAEQPGCLVVDDFHAVTSGTSMAAPIVSGAIALLLSRKPTLTQPELRAVLQAGAHWPVGKVLLDQQLGPGVLDLVGALQVLDADVSPLTEIPDADHSWLSLASSYAHPDPEWPLIGFVELRGPNGIADGFDAERLSLSATHGSISEALTRVAPGLWRFAVAAPANSGGQQLSLALSFDGKPLLQRNVAIAVDRWVAEEGVSTQGGCSVGRGRGRLFAFALLALGLAALTRRRWS